MPFDDHFTFTGLFVCNLQGPKSILGCSLDAQNAPVTQATKKAQKEDQEQEVEIEAEPVPEPEAPPKQVGHG